MKHASKTPKYGDDKTKNSPIIRRANRKLELSSNRRVEQVSDGGITGQEIQDSDMLSSGTQ
jgi:hypothetical protein